MHVFYIYDGTFKFLVFAVQIFYRQTTEKKLEHRLRIFKEEIYPAKSLSFLGITVKP